MLDHLAQQVPVQHVVATAEQIPLRSRSVDLVVCGQSFHWFDHERALPEIARVLKPGGHLALVWNVRDERIPWVRKLGRVIGTQEQPRDPSDDLAASDLFHETTAEPFKHWQTVDRRTIVDLARSRSNLAVMGDAERDRVLADLLALYDDYGRGMDGMQLPYRTLCYRSEALDRPAPAPAVPEPVLEPTVPLAFASSASLGQSGGSSLMTDSATTIPRVAIEADDDTGMILIDFR